MKKLVVFLAVLLCAVLLTCAAMAEVAYPSNTGALKVTGTQLTDQAGNPVQLRGLSTHGLAWFPQYVNAEAFQQFHDEFGVNCIRLAMYTAEYGGYCTNGRPEKMKQLVLDGVKYATDADMYVIVDWHVLADKDPNVYIDQAVAFFDEVSATLAGQDNVLYEICNEPNSGTTWAMIKAYADVVITVIRANDPDAVILVGTPNWCQEIMTPASAPLTYDNVMYDLHFYTATHGQYLRDRMVSAINAGIPIFVTEYGVCSADGNGTYDFDSADKWAALLDEYNVSYMMWGIANKAELCATFKPGCAKVSGFTRKDLTEGALWLVDHLGGTLPEGEDEVIDPDAAMTLTGTYGGWVDTGSGANAYIQWVGNTCTVEVTASGKSAWHVQPSFSGLTLEKGKTYQLTYTITCDQTITYDAVLQRNYGSYGAYAGINGRKAGPEATEVCEILAMTGTTDSNVALVFNLGANACAPYTVTITNVVLTCLD